MGTRASNPLVKDHAERREVMTEHFVAVTEGLIASGHAYADLSVEQLIQAAGISRGTFYAYYEDKGDLMRAMGDTVNAAISAQGPAWWDLAEDPSWTDLREGLRPAFEAYLEHRVLLGAMAEASSYDPKVRETYGQLMATNIALLTEHIRKHQRSRHLSRQIDAEQTATWLIWMLERGLHQAVSAADELESWLTSLTDIVWNALYARSPRK